LNYDQIEQRLAPCGLHCGKFCAFKDCDIKNYSILLRESLGGFDNYASMFVDLLNEPLFKTYPDFKEMLAYFASVDCEGCRTGKCKIFKNCKVRDCHKEKRVDFCYQCISFPFDITGFDKHLYRRFASKNKRMEEIGVERYFDEIENETRY
jgi:hypothetical protein